MCVDTDYDAEAVTNADFDDFGCARFELSTIAADEVKGSLYLERLANRWRSAAFLYGISDERGNEHPILWSNDPDRERCVLVKF
jgi:hypothetical protein